MANKLIKNAYKEFYNNRMEKHLKNISRRWLDESGNLLQEQIAKGITIDDVNKTLAEERKLFHKLNDPRDSQIHYQELFFENMRKNDQALKINDKLYSVSGHFSFEYDPDNAKSGMSFTLSPLDVPTDGGNIKAYSIGDWFGATHGQKGGTLGDDYVRNAYANNLNKFINNPNIEVVDLGREELKRRNKEVRDYVRSGKGSFEINHDAEGLLGKPQKIVRLQQGKGSYRTSRPIREPKQVGPKRGDQYYNPKTKRQFVYDGPDDIVKGGHNLISDQGHVFLSYMDELEPGTGPGRKPLDYDLAKKYNDTLTEMSELAADRDSLKYKDPDKYYEQLQNNIKDLKRHEREVKKQIKNHRMGTDDYKKMKYLQSQVDRYYKDNPDKQIKQLEKQKKKAEKDVKKIEKQADRELKNLKNEQQEKKQTEAKRKATENSKKVSQSTDEETAKPQIEGNTVEETIDATQQTVETKVENIANGTEKGPDVINENISSQSTNPKKGYADWIDDVYPENVSPMVTNSDHIDTVRKWASATDEGIEDYIKTLENDYASESIKFIKNDLYDNRDRAKKILEARNNAFTSPGVEQSSAHKNLYTKTSNTGVKSEMVKMPLSEDEITKLVNDTAANVMNDLGIEEDFLVNTVFGKTQQDGVKGLSSAYDADINIDNIWASAQQKNRKRKTNELRKQYPEMNDDEFTDWIFDHSDLLDTTAEELAEEIQETVAHETRHYWQRTNKEAHEQMNGKHQGNFESYEDYLNNDLEVDARDYAKDYMERQKNINTNTSQQNMNSGNTKSNTNTADDIDMDNLSPEEQARKILDENLEYQKNKNRFGEVELIPDIDGGPQVNPANIPSGPNYNPNVNLDNGYNATKIESVYNSGNTNTVLTSANYTHRNVVPPAGGGGKGPRGVSGSGGNGGGGGPTSPNNLVPIGPNGPNGNGANKVVSRLDELKNMGKFEMLMTAGNVLGAISDYKDARREGHGVVSSALKAGVNFAIEEALGNWAIVYHAAKWLPQGIIKGTEALYKENRRMNSAANVQVFGGAQFQDTQQLATMRQSGMEMAKMAQYNLQQTLMGQEATYLHR